MSFQLFSNFSSLPQVIHNLVHILQHFQIKFHYNSKSIPFSILFTENNYYSFSRKSVGNGSKKYAESHFKQKKQAWCKEKYEINFKGKKIESIFVVFILWYCDSQRLQTFLVILNWNVDYT